MLGKKEKRRRKERWKEREDFRGRKKMMKKCLKCFSYTFKNRCKCGGKTVFPVYKFRFKFKFMKGSK